MGPTTAFGDCGEFITSSHIVGIPHQPGTPLYVLVGRVFDVLSGSGDTAARSWNRPGRQFHVRVLQRPGRDARVPAGLGTGPPGRPGFRLAGAPGRVIGAFFLAFSDTFWNNAVEAEVYGLAAFMIVLLAWLAVRWYDHRDRSGSDLLLLLMIYLLGLGWVSTWAHCWSTGHLPAGGCWPAPPARPRDLFLMSVAWPSSCSPPPRATTPWWSCCCWLRRAGGDPRLPGPPLRPAGHRLFCVGLSVHAIMLIRASAVPEPLINQTDPDTFATLMSVIRARAVPAA